jgi:hypothetical protein
MLAEKQTNPIIPPDDQNWSMVIQPPRNWLDLRLGILRRDKDLALFSITLHRKKIITPFLVLHCYRK